MDQVVPRVGQDRTDEINLIEIAQRVGAQWRIVAVCAIVALLFGVMTLHLATYTYTAALKVTPVQGETQNSTLLRQLGGLASVAGLTGPNVQTTTPFFLYVESVVSRSVADELAEHGDLMQVIFAPEWDPLANRFVERKSWLRGVSDALKEAIGIRIYPWTPPDGARLQIYLQDKVKVAEDRTKPLVTLSYDHEDPAFAVKFLSLLNQTIDNQLRKKTLERVNENISYLSRQLATVSVAEHRQAIMETLSEQEKSKMMMNSSAPVAAEIVSGPNASFRPTKPQALQAIIGWLAGGIFIGGMTALVWEGFARRLRGNA